MESGAKRTLVTGTLAALGLFLIGVAVYDVYADAVLQGDPLWTTLLENALPLLLNSLLLVMAVRIHGREVEADLAGRVSRWSLASVGLVVGFAVWVYGFQLLQSQLKPVLILVDMVSVGALAGIAIGIYDTERVARERKYKNERDRFATLFEHVPSPVVGVDVGDEGSVVREVNAAFEDAFGLHTDDVAGEPLDRFLAPEAEVEAATGTPDEWTEHSVTLELPAGRREFLRLGPPGRSGHRYAIFIDVTERKQREERLHVLSRTLRHDIRNKMTVVEGNASMLEERLDGELAAVAAQIRDAAEDLTSLSERARAIEEAVDSDTGSVDAVEAAKRAVAEVSRRHPRATYQLSLPDEAAVATGEALGVALREILENAVVHSGDEPSVRVRIEDVDDGYREIVVADDGPGIPEHERAVVVGERSRSQLEHTSGLGLWLVNWVAMNAGGDLQIERTSGGTAVRLRVPAAT